MTTGSTDAGNLAQLYIGLCQANLGKWQEAVNALESFSGKGDAMISPAAEGALGNAYANLNQARQGCGASEEGCFYG